MSAATAVDRCPVCDMRHPCATQLSCLTVWADLLLAMFDVEEEPYGFGD
jgi:hypothetical protein